MRTPAYREEGLLAARLAGGVPLLPLSLFYPSPVSKQPIHQTEMFLTRALPMPLLRPTTSLPLNVVEAHWQAMATGCGSLALDTCFDAVARRLPLCLSVLAFCSSRSLHAGCRALPQRTPRAQCTPDGLPPQRPSAPPDFCPSPSPLCHAGSLSSLSGRQPLAGTQPGVWQKPNQARQARRPQPRQARRPQSQGIQPSSLQASQPRKGSIPDPAHILFISRAQQHCLLNALWARRGVTGRATVERPWVTGRGKIGEGLASDCGGGSSAPKRFVT